MRDPKTKQLIKCPVCGKVPNSMAFYATNNKYVFRHRYMDRKTKKMVNEKHESAYLEPVPNEAR